MIALFAPCWLGEPGRIERNTTWLNYNLSIKDKLGFDKIILFDNASDIYDLVKLNATVYDEDGKLLIANPESDVIVYRFHEHLARTGIWEYPYCWRVLKYAQSLIPQLGITRVLFIDTDFYVLTSKMADYMKSLTTGWVSFFCHKYGFPEAALQVICNDNLQKFIDFPIPSYTHYNNQHMEWLLPFTHVDKTEFKGDRYGEGCQKQTLDMDWYGQWNTGCSRMIFDVKK